MSGTSYPSPVSSAGSPSLFRGPVRVLPGPEVLSHDPRPRSSASNSSLQPRNRHPRQQVIDLSEERQRFTSEFDPGHESIILSGSPLDDISSDEAALERLRSPLTTTAMERLRQFESSQVQENEPEDRTNRPPRPSITILDTVSESTDVEPPTFPSRTVLNSPVSPPRQNLLPRRSLIADSSQSTRRRELTDDSTTFLGRHVAAREAAGSSGEAAHNLRRRPMPPSIERDLEMFRAFVRTRRSDPAVLSRIEHALEVQRRSDQDRATRSLDTSTALGTQTPPSPSASRAGATARRARARDSRPPSIPSTGSSIHADRLSLLSNFSVQNLSSPISALSLERPLLFEEPTSYVSPTGPMSAEERTADSVAPGGYLVRRRLNAEGQEIVHNINVEWEDDDPTTWGFPSDPVHDEDHPGDIPHPPARWGYIRGHPVRSNTSVLRPSWDDPTELPSEEEEPFDVFRTRERPRTRPRAARHIMPLTRTSYSHEDATDEPRVRLNQGDPSPLSGLLSVPLYGSDKPFYFDPLPQPHSDMLSSSKDGQERQCGSSETRAYRFQAGR